MVSDKNILLTTVYKRHKNDIYDYWKANTPENTFFRYSLPRVNAFGLRFIKQNLPRIEILEFPSWKEYTKKLDEKNWDIVGFSFYLNEIHEILEMAEYARQQGVSELWAGNYGALTGQIEKNFDKIFYGYSERKIADYLGWRLKNKEIIHPPLPGYVSTPHGIKVNSFGYLFTSRGCPYKCKFCQTPSFCPKPSRISLKNIEKVLKYYRKIGITQVMLLEENFGTFRKHADKVVELLDKYNFYWFTMVRADYLEKKIDEWTKKGLIGVLTGIENLNQSTLDDISKKEKINDILSLIRHTKEYNLMTVGFYMIGFPEETKNSIRKDLKRVGKLDMDITQICVLTPLPKTPLWDEIDEKYGIFDKNWRHYNAKHLVWNHPNVTPEEMRELLQYGFKVTYPKRRIFQSGQRFVVNYLKNRGILKGTKYTIKQFILSNTFNYQPNKKRFLY
ncbi:MAG: radical SAM protein [Candidatus Thermoplasmatota archaeon]